MFEIRPNRIGPLVTWGFIALTVITLAVAIRGLLREVRWIGVDLTAFSLDPLTAGAPITARIQLTNRMSKPVRIQQAGATYSWIERSEQFPETATAALSGGSAPCDRSITEAAPAIQPGQSMWWCFLQNSPVLSGPDLEALKGGNSKPRLWLGTIVTYADHAQKIRQLRYCRFYNFQTEAFEKSEKICDWFN